jgi:hypothetical protein
MLKKLKLAVVALLLPLIAFAQSYPSPTFNNVTVQGTLTAATPAFTNPLPVSSGGTGVSSFTTGNVLVGAAGGGLTTVGTTSAGLPLISSGTGFVPVWTPLTLAGGGTSATTAAQARTNLGAAATASGLNQFAATTSAQLAGVISDETGTGSLVFGTAPTISNLNATGTPTAPTATAGTNTTQIATTAFVLANASGCTSCTITTPNIVGVSNGSNAASGSVGEYLSNSATGVSLTSGAVVNVTSVSLTAGDWDVSGVVTFVPAGTTTSTLQQVGTNTTSATFGPLGTQVLSQGSFGSGLTQSYVVPTVRYSLAATTTIFLVAEAVFSTSTMTANGFIRARRVR